MRTALARRSALGVLLVLMLIWPALYNGQGIFFFDSLTYLRGADTGVVALLHHHSHWSLPSRTVATAPAAPAEPSSGASASTSTSNDKTVLIGRSWFYGALLYAGDLLGGFWFTVVLQAVAALATLALTLRAVRLPQKVMLPVTAVLALTTSLPFYASFLMPDVFTGIVLAVSAVLLTREVLLERWQLLGCWGLLSAGALFHDTNLLLLCTLLVVALAVRAVAGVRHGVSGVIVLFAAVVIGLLGQVAFALGVEHWYGIPPIHPPFLTARLIEDGTGVRYLRASCPDNGFQVCAFLDRLPMPADDFLWQTRPGAGVFATATPEVRRRLSAEQMRLARAVFAFDPLGQLLASLRNAAHQLLSSGLWEFEYTREEKAEFDEKFPKELLPRLHASAAYRLAMPIAAFELVLKLTYYCSVGVIGAALLWRRTRLALPPVAIGVTAWMVAGVLLNAIWCGALSGPHERYSARVQWLLPLAAMLLLAWIAARRSLPVTRRAAQAPESGTQ